MNKNLKCLKTAKLRCFDIRRNFTKFINLINTVMAVKTQKL